MSGRGRHHGFWFGGPVTGTDGTQDLDLGDHRRSMATTSEGSRTDNLNHHYNKLECKNLFSHHRLKPINYHPHSIPAGCVTPPGYISGRITPCNSTSLYLAPSILHMSHISVDSSPKKLSEAPYSCHLQFTEIFLKHLYSHEAVWSVPSNHTLTLRWWST